MKSTAVNIDGIELSLKSDDEELLRRSAKEVNEQISQIRRKYKEELPQTTLLILASLNMAEMLEKERKQYLAERQYLLSEIERMTSFLSENTGK